MCKYGLALMKELIFLDQISRWLGVLREIIWSEDSKSSKHITLRTCVNDLVFHERKRNKTFHIHGGKSARELWEIHSYYPHILHELGTRIMISRASSWNMEKLRVWLKGSTTIRQDFDRDEFPKLKYQGDSTCQIKWYNVVCSREQQQLNIGRRVHSEIRVE